ncbi:tandem-95 repeat protein [Ramlibacter sp. MAHUQ-53]|uniref:tandem-95 repeat protein n=1 Tax=unclassified Ramlibacter TaxID=2617605 RepID=UPI00363E34C8
MSLRFTPARPSELLIADGLATELDPLLHEARLPALALGHAADPLQALTCALAGETLNTLHLVAHGARGGLSIAGHWIDREALERGAHLLAHWRVRRIALWACDVGLDTAWTATLARLTGAEVWAAGRPLGRDPRTGRSHWRLAGGRGQAPALPFHPRVAQAWPHQLVTLQVQGLYRATASGAPDGFFGEETSSVTINTTAVSTTRVTFSQAGVQFSGNNVLGTVSYEANGVTTTFTGLASRPIKVGGVVKGFYVWLDNDGSGAGTSGDTAFILSLDNSYFSGNAAIGSSSDRVDSSMNSVLPVNSAPVGVNDSAILNEDASAAGNVLANDTDANGDTLSVTAFTIGGTSGSLGQATAIPGVGSFTLAATGAYTFTPVSNYAGTVPLVKYTLSDGNGGTATASLSLSITPVNDAPTSTHDSVTTREDTAIVLGLGDFGSYADAESTPLAKVKVTSLPGAGSLQYNSSGSTWAPVTAGQEITAADIAAGKLRFTPAAEAHGSPYTSLQFQVSDGAAYGAGTYTLTVNVTPVNDAPTGSNDTLTLAEDAIAVLGLGDFGTFTDIDGDPLASVQVTSLPAAGALQYNSGGTWGAVTLNQSITAADIAAGKLRFVPAADASGSPYASVGYTVSDGTATSAASYTLAITATPANDAPIAVADYNSARESTTATSGFVSTGYNATGNVLANDTDPDTGDTRSIVGITANASASAGTVAVTAGSAKLIFRGDSGFTSVNGGEEAYVKLSTDAAGDNYRGLYYYNGSSYSLVSVHTRTTTGSDSEIVLNYTPTHYANGGSYVAISNLATFLTTNASVLFENSSSATENASGGKTATVSNTTSSGYTDLTGLSAVAGSITAGMTVSGPGTTAGMTVSSVTYTNGVITAVRVGGEFSVATGGAYTFSSTVTAGQTFTGTHGTLTLGANGSYTYTPTTDNARLASGQSAVEVFSYTMQDSTGAQSSSTLNITVYGAGSNDPVAAADTGAATEAGTSAGANASGNLLSNDKETAAATGPGTTTLVAGARLSGAAADTAIGTSTTVAGRYGTLTLSSNGAYSYAPNDSLPAVNALGAGQSLTDTFQYRITNAPTSSGSSIATLTITLNGANDAPTTTDDAATTSEDTSLVLSAPDFGSYADAEGTALASVKITSLPAAGALQYNSTGTTWVAVTANQVITAADLAAGKLRFVPVADAHGSPYATVGFQVGDGTAFSATSTLTLNVLSVNDAPVNTLPANPGTPDYATLSLTGLSVADVDNNLASSGTVTLSVAHGTLSATASGGITVSGTGTPADPLVLSGASSAALNTVLGTLAYRATAGFSGADSLRITTVDAGGLSDTDVLGLTVTPDSRALTVTGTTANEASPYVFFQVGGATGQRVALSLSGLTATAGADFAPALEWWDGAQWQAYTAGSYATLPAATLQVRVALMQDGASEGSETLRLTAANVAGTAFTGDSSIVDDGAGTVYAGTLTSGVPDTSTSNLDDDRALTVSSITVNEASPYAVFQVGGAAGQVLTLAVVGGTATPTSDYDAASLQVLVNGAWVAYGTAATIPAGGTLLARVALANDNPAAYEGPETFGLRATNGSGVPTTGTATIVDDGTGSVYDATTGAVDGAAAKDNDLSVSVVAHGPVNEASTHAMFTVTATPGENLALSLAGAGAAQATVAGFTMAFSYDGATWTTYSSAVQPNVPGNGKVYVRVDITPEHDTNNEADEGFSLTASTATGAGAAGSATSTIVDDGNGTIYTGGVTAGSPVADTTTVLDQDTSVSTTVNDLTVNEASSFAIFTVTGAPGGTVTLSLLEGSGSNSADLAAQTLKVWNATTSAWDDYTTSATLPAVSGTLYVRVATAQEQDTTYEGAEPFQLVVTPGNGGSAVTGTATIRDDGAGTIYAGTITNGAPDASTSNLDDDRAVTVNSITVNEASPYAVFEVGGAAGQVVTLSMVAGSATSTSDYDASSLQVLVNGAWVSYGASATIPAGGTLLARVALANDNPAVYEGPETFGLRAANGGGTAATGTATIVDGGTGSIYPDNTTGAADAGAVKDDDRTLSVNPITVNEASDYAVFTVSGTAGRVVSLALLEGSGSNTADLAAQTLKVWNATSSTWDDYATSITLPAGGTLYVRVAIGQEQDASYEGSEPFQLQVTPVGGGSAVLGTATIKDDGTGVRYPGTFTSGTLDTSTASLDDDRTAGVSSATVNEASPWAVWTVTGNPGSSIALTVSGTSTGGGVDRGPALQVSLDGGVNWADYSAGSPPRMPAGGSLLVRTPVVEDTVSDNGETIVLTATPSGGTAASGTITIDDAGAGQIHNPDGTTNANLTRTDDRPTVSVSHVTVSEAQPYAVVSVSLSNASDTNVSFAPTLSSGTATVGTDTGGTLQWYDGANWVAVATSTPTITAGQLSLQLRVALAQDNLSNEGTEAFRVVTGAVTGGVRNGAGASGTVSITDVASLTDPVITDVTETPADPTPYDLLTADTTQVVTLRGEANCTVSLFLRDGQGNLTAVNASQFTATEAGGIYTLDFGSHPLVAGDYVARLSRGGYTSNLSNAFTIDSTPGLYDITSRRENVKIDATTTVTRGAVGGMDQNRLPTFWNGTDWLDSDGEKIRFSFDTIATFSQSAVPAGTTVTRTVASGSTLALNTQTGAYSYTPAASATIDQFFLKASDGGHGASLTLTFDARDTLDRDGIGASVETRLAANANTAGGVQGDLNGDGIADANQNAVTTLAWTTVDQFNAAIAGTLTDFTRVMSVAVMQSTPGSAVDDSAQLSDVKVLAPTSAATGGSKPAGAAWDPIQFTIEPLQSMGLVDADPARAGTQVRVVLDISRAQVAAGTFTGYQKYVSAGALAGNLVDLEGRPITSAGWYDFTQRTPGGDGARFITSGGIVTAIELTLTDNAFGDNDLAVGRIVDPGVPTSGSSSGGTVDTSPPVITGPSGGPGAAASAKSVPENARPVATFTANEAVAWSLAGGNDAGLFTLDAASGALAFTAAPDYELPRDANGNNIHELQVRATDAAGNASVQSVLVTVTDLDEVAPRITGPSGGAGAASSAKTVPENTLPVATFAADEAATWGLAGGADAALFRLDPATGALRFAAAPDYELPQDANRDNLYDLVVRAADAAGNASLQSVRVTVADVNETPAKLVYGALLPNGDRTLSLAVTPGAQPAFATTDRVGSDTLPLAAWRNALTGDWFYAPAGQAMPYACYVAAADPGLGRVLAPGQGAFDVHLYLRADGLTQEMSQAAAQQLGLLSQGYVDQGALFASVALVGVAA